MNKFSIEKRLNNGNIISLYTDTYGISYVVTAFTCDYKVLKSRKTTEYNLALHYMTIYENMFSRKEGKQ
jgi:hypothetical protein